MYKGQNIDHNTYSCDKCVLLDCYSSSLAHPYGGQKGK